MRFADSKIADEKRAPKTPNTSSTRSPASEEPTHPSGLPLFLRGSEQKVQHEHGNEVGHQLPGIQKKSIGVSNPIDRDEKEAEAVARKVVHGQSAQIDGTGGTVDSPVEGPSEITSEFQSNLATSAGSGQSLRSDIQLEMGSRMGTDFSDVRVHTGSEAHNMSESVNAEAFTHGNDVYFGRGKYDPDSKQGRELLAHELAHTKQQLSGKIHRRIIVGGVETSASSLQLAVTAEVNTWYTAIVGNVTAQMGTLFNAADDMPFDLNGAVDRAIQILKEMENAKHQKETWGYDSKTGREKETFSRDDYDFSFGTATDVSNEVLFRLSLMLNTHLQADTTKTTSFAEYPAGEEGFNLQDKAQGVWKAIGTTNIFEPGGFQLQTGAPSAAIKQITTPPVDANQRIVIDCATMMGILYYKSLLGTTAAEASRFDKKFQNTMIVGPLTAQFGPELRTKHPLKSNDNPARNPYLKPVVVSSLKDLVPGDTVVFANYGDYGKLEPSGLWNGEWAVYTKSMAKTLYFEGFGVPERSYEEIMDLMQAAYDDAADSKGLPHKIPETSDLTIEGKVPGIKVPIFRVDLAAYSK